MPKVMIGYTSNIDAEKLKMQEMINDIHTAMGQCEDFNKIDINIMAHKSEHYAVRENDGKQASIVADIQIFAGRVHPLKAAVGKVTSDVIHKYVDNYETDLDITISCVVHEIHRDITFF